MLGNNEPGFGTSADPSFNVPTRAEQIISQPEYLPAEDTNIDNISVDDLITRRKEIFTRLAQVDGDRNAILEEISNLDNLEARKLRREHWLASHDTQTGFLNMRGLEEGVLEYFRSPLARRVAPSSPSPDGVEMRSKLTNSENCVVFLDMNGMKGLNSLYGYSGTDEIIIQFSKLAERLRKYDITARVKTTGDEFAIFMPFADSKVVGQVIAEVTQEILKTSHKITAKRLVKKGEEPIVEEVPLTFAIGVKSLPADYPDPDMDKEGFKECFNATLSRASELQMLAKEKLGKEHDQFTVAYEDTDGNIEIMNQDEAAESLANYRETNKSV